MSYLTYAGIKYGVKPDRSFFKSLLLNLPIINLFYTRKIRVNVLTRTQRGEPIQSIFETFRIWRFQKTVRCKTMVPETYQNIMIWASNSKDEWISESLKLASDVVFHIGHEYDFSINIKKS